MRILAIESAGQAASAAIYEEKLISEVYVNRGLTHSEQLMGVVEKAVDASGKGLSAIDAVAVGIGPGSFTGLRIGVATAKGIAHGLSLPMIPVGTLAALAQNGGGFSGLVCPILDARRQEVYTALYQAGEELVSPCAVALEQILFKIKEQACPALFMGDGVLAYRERIEETLGKTAHFCPPQLLLQRASAVAYLASLVGEEGFQEPGAVVPEYLRLSQAEREAKKKEQR